MKVLVELGPLTPDVREVLVDAWATILRAELAELLDEEAGAKVADRVSPAGRNRDDGQNMHDGS